MDKNKKVKAFTLIEGDKVLIANSPKVIKSIREIDKHSIAVDYFGGSLGIYQRQNFVTKVYE